MKPTQFGLLALLLILSGCAEQAVSQSTAPTPTVITGTETGSSQPRLTLTLTLTAPDDLKVKEGDSVLEWQVLADRTRDRQRLEAQIEKLQFQMAKLNQSIPGPPATRPIPEVAGLPPASFLDEVAEVERQRVMVRQAESTVMQQQRMLDMLQSIPNAELPEATVPHEQEVLHQKQQELEQTRAAMELAQAKLGQAQSDRQYQEYQHSLELSKRAIAIQQAQLQRQEQLQNQQIEERDRAFKLAQLESQMQTLQTQLFTLSAVRSPYRGTIQRIKIQEQHDQNLMVELVLMAHADGSAESGTPRSVSGGINPGGNGTGGNDTRGTR